MENKPTKDSRLNIRCDPHARQMLAKAANYAHVSVSEFVLSHALASAEKLVQSKELITLKPQDFQDFLAALDAPAQPNPALKAAMRRHAKQVVR